MDSTSFADLVGQVDVAFVIDTTGSMGPFIDAARTHIRGIADEIGRNGDLDLRFAVVEYRDHPPQEPSFVTRSYPFSDGEALQLALDSLRPDGGGDAPEAVLDGLLAAAALQWRAEADRLCFLVGDAPPHGYGGSIASLPTVSADGFVSPFLRRVASGDAWPEGCPCRATPNGVVELMRGHRIQVHAIALQADPVLASAFRELSEATGGSLTEADHSPAAAVEAVASSMASTSATVGAARHFLAAAAEIGSADPAAVAPAMGMPKQAAEGVAAYLRKRGLLPRDR